jgi:DNA-binding HxlR family transcriptional regulator
VLTQDQAATHLRLPWAPQHACTADTKSLVRDMLTRIGDKWTMLVVGTLASGPLRFSALQAEINGISHRMLTVTLRALERDGLVTRSVFAEVPPRVEYELTETGATLIEPLGAVISWAEGHQVHVAASRALFDA